MFGESKTLTVLISTILVAMACCGCQTADYLKADIMLTQGKYGDAVPVLEAFVAENPEFVDARSRLGFAYLKTGRIDEAIASFNKAIEMQPGEPYAVLYLGLAYLNKGEFNEAIAVWEGYKDPARPIVEAEVKRLTTLVQIAESQKAAKLAIANEKKMQALALDNSTVAVFYYKDLTQSNELRGFQKALSAMVISDLSKIKSLQVVERLRMQALLQEIDLGQTGIVSPETAPRIGRMIGAENLVVGTLAGGIQVATTLASSNTSAIKGTATATIDKTLFFEIPKRIVLDTAKIMRIELTAEEKLAIGSPHTKNYDAMIHYGLALDAMDAGHWTKAKDLFTKALQEDPRFELLKRGGEGCPSGSSPSIGQLSSMTASQIASMAESAIDQALAKQAQLDEEDEQAGGGGGGGGGGH
jgi:tetratricopeptide (TPR) repeat protein